VRKISCDLATVHLELLSLSCSFRHKACALDILIGIFIPKTAFINQSLSLDRKIALGNSILLITKERIFLCSSSAADFFVVSEEKINF
jgi:hypothetical protein